ncbi:hypothetical protein GGR56DRAFT_692223 [Xylariaceae sp. FL0804]|nr:hypothetical protein GGR56DRAFT_692223 [Xylariaceae sp. FL0804]
MKRMQLFPWFVLAISMQEAASLKLNVTAIGARDGSSTLECWQMDQAFSISAQPGTSGTAQTTLGSVDTLSYTVIPPNFDGGVHNAPQNQWVVFTSGLAHITLPNNNNDDDDDSSTSGAYVSGGESGLLFAADTADVSRRGHRTRYPGVTATTALQIPTRDGRVPEHSVLHAGPCSTSEITGGVHEIARTGTTDTTDTTLGT